MSGTKTKKQEPGYFIGLMSGTSMDNVDAAIVTIKGTGVGSDVSFVESIAFPYPHGLREKMIACITENRIPLSEISQLNFLIGKIFADAVHALLDKAKLKAKKIKAIGSHGQTLWHNPDKRSYFDRNISSTLQVGESAVIQARTGITTVSNFRSKDIALGGQGAPLIPYFDYLLLRSDKHHVGALNLGGIANITVIPKSAQMNKVFAFDTGPANILVDGLMQKLYKKSFDANGKIAGSAHYDPQLFDKLMSHDFIEKPIPKSTGREDFGDAFMEQVIAWSEDIGLSDEEIISTVTEFTVRSIHANYENFIRPHFPLEKIIYSGGGAKNKRMISRLKKYFENVTLQPIDDYGIPSESKEAIAFAVFASETLAGNPINVPSATGASHSAISGDITY